MDPTPLPADWLHDAVLDGLQSLLCLALDGQPAREVIPGTLAAWCEAIGLHRDLRLQRDLPRIREAFAMLRATVRRWPSPRDFTELLDRTPADPSVKRETVVAGVDREAQARAVLLGQFAAERNWERQAIVDAGWVPPEGYAGPGRGSA